MPSSPSKVNQEIVVRAGAGAGKTTWLTSQVFELAENYFSQHGSYPNLVVTTFTRKATQELRERLILKACQDNKPELVQFVSSGSKLLISTIHGVLVQFIRRYGHLVGLDNSLNLLTESGARRFGLKVLRNLYTESALRPSLVELFGYKRLYVLLRSHYSLVMENPDVKGATQEQFLKALEGEAFQIKCELLEIAVSIEESTGDEKWMSFAQGLHRIADALEDPIRPESFWPDLQLALDALGAKPRVSKKSPQVNDDLDGRIKESLKSCKVRLKSDLFNPESWDQFLDVFHHFSEVASLFSKRFVEEKRQTGQIEMEDLELLVLKALREFPEVAAAFSQEWNYWLVDEYQDTSPLQVELLRALVGESPSYTVGDPQQSIYLFRGSSEVVFSQREEEVKRRSGERRQLMKNYRSKPELLEFF